MRENKDLNRRNAGLDSYERRPNGVPRKSVEENAGEAQKVLDSFSQMPPQNGAYSPKDEGRG